MNEIDQTYDKVNNEIIKSYEKKHEELLKQENDLKENLQNEVTKVKEKLEIFLSELNRLIKINEKINKGIKMLEKEKEKNMIKNLSYISKINKNKKEMKTIVGELLKNLKISFKEEKNTIEFKEYYFNGIQTPKNIEFKEVGDNYLKLTWEFDDIKIVNIDNNQIKFKVECRKENEKFIKVYEGNEKNCIIENLNQNTNYEIRICCFYNDLIGLWSEIKKIKTNHFNSIILKESQKEKEYIEKIIEWTGCKCFELLYRGSRDGSKSTVFHNKCDNQGPTICLYKNENGNIFGGYTSFPWTSPSDRKYNSDPYSFIFTLSNIHNIKPTKFPNLDAKYNVRNDKNCGPSFGGEDADIAIYEDFNSRDSYTNFPQKYKDTSEKGKSIFTGEYEKKGSSYKIKEIKVFKCLK